ncbi:aldehyde dehydrogenase (NADP(+)) [Pseudonocardia sp.]|uniref:aldehyde dehydrogenase (NADP(+)) n=1 Tax=Pseudonocardia sp. TaxID=60912 RepID=UPI002633BCE4|nr:aldehyde dehydrogenase (NADP(+)) [Pseudonocardia sp.]
MSPVLSMDPRTGEQVEVAAVDTAPAEVAQVVARVAATAATLDGLGRVGRTALLRAVAAELEADAAGLVAIADRETALGEARLTGELGRACYQLRYLADAVAEGGYLEALAEPAADTPLGPRPDLRRMLVPLGPVAVFGASNFPFAFSVAGGDTAAALAAGCPVVVKAHPGHPATSLRSIDAVHRALSGFPGLEHAVDLVFGLEAGRAVVVHPEIRAVGFTGSSAGGRALHDLTAARPDPIPFFGELAGVNPFVVTPGAAAARGPEIGRGVIDSVTLGTGQFCTKPGLLFVPEGDAGDALLAAAEQAVREREPGLLLTSTTHATYRSTIEALTALPGVRTTAHGPAGPEVGYAGVAHLVTIGLADLRPEFVEECFGPAAVAVRYGDPRELVATLGTLRGGLTATVHSEPAEAELVAELTAVFSRIAGRLVYDGYPTGVAVTDAMTHGGPWPSTTNSQHTSVGVHALRRFLRPVTWQNAPQHALPTELRD